MIIHMKRLARHSLATVLSTAALILASPASAELLRMGMVTPPPHIWNKVAARFNQNLQETADGAFQIKVFPLGKLGGEPQMIDLLQTGGIQLAVLTAAGLSNRESAFNAWFMPGLFSDVTDAAAATQKSEAQQMLAKLDSHKLVGLGYTLAGMRHVLSLEPTLTPEDFAQQKIRSFPNKVFNDWWRSLDAAPTALPTSEVTPALNTNLLDSVDVDLDLVVGLKMYQQAPNLTLTNHMAFPGVVVASKPWWTSLSSEQQQQVITAFKEAESWGFQQQAKAELSNIERLKSEGVQVFEFDLQALTPLIETVSGRYLNADPSIRAFYEQNR